MWNLLTQWQVCAGTTGYRFRDSDVVILLAIAALVTTYFFA